MDPPAHKVFRVFRVILALQVQTGLMELTVIQVQRVFQAMTA
jgi:hypothetical protein